jgi:two-component system OmpR family response regulator
MAAGPDAPRILLVEDDNAIRKVAALSLRMLGGFDVLALPSGEAALAQAAGYAPALILLDVSMPGMDGRQTLQALRAQPAVAGVPVVFVTAGTQSRDVAALKALGAIDVIAKPFDPAALCERVRALLDAA